MTTDLPVCRLIVAAKLISWFFIFGKSADEPVTKGSSITITLRGFFATGPLGTTGLLGPLGELAPKALRATTVKVYVVPLVRPLTRQVRTFGSLTVHVKPPGPEVTT